MNVKPVPTALILCANGTEEIELVVVADVLRRAEIKVTIASIHGTEPITCSRGVKIIPDCALEEVADKLFSVVVLPGGLGGSENFQKSELAAKVVRKHDEELRYVAAICAAPLAIKEYGIGKYKSVTSHPVVKNLMLNDSSYQYKEDRVVVDENLITSRAPGTAFEFAIEIVDKLIEKSKISSIVSPLMLRDDKKQPNKTII